MPLTPINALLQLYTRQEIIYKLGKHPNYTFNNHDIEGLSIDIGGNESIKEGTIKKLLGISATDNGLKFQTKTLDAIAIFLGFPRWKSYIHSKDLSVKKIKNLTIPEVRYQDLSNLWKERLIETTNKLLLKNQRPLLENDFKKEIDDSERVLFRTEIPERLSPFFNTQWYLYFFYKNYSEIDGTVPSFGRVVLLIGKNTREVSIKNFYDMDNTDYKGSVELDSTNTVLIFNFKTLANSKCLHMKFDINTVDLPEIALGRYSNLNTGGVGIISGTIIMEYQGKITEEDTKLSPKIINTKHKEFLEIDNSIRRYLSNKSLNYHETKTRIFSKRKLSSFLKDYQPSLIRRMKFDCDTKIIISTPKYSINAEAFKHKMEYVDKLIIFLEDNLKFQILHKPSIKYVSKYATPRLLNFYINKIKESDIFILFYFNETHSSCLMELAWAIAELKDIHIFTKQGLLPKIMGTNNPDHVRIYFHFANEEDAVNHIIDNHQLLFEKYI